MEYFTKLLNPQLPLLNISMVTNVTRLGDLLDFGQVFKAFGNNQFAQISHILRQFCKGTKINHFSSEIVFGQLYRYLAIFFLVILMVTLSLFHAQSQKDSMRISVWKDPLVICSIFDHLQQWQFAQQQFLCQSSFKVVSKFCQIKTNTKNYRQRL